MVAKLPHRVVELLCGIDVGFAFPEVYAPVLHEMPLETRGENRRMLIYKRVV